MNIKIFKHKNIEWSYKITQVDKKTGEVMVFSGKIVKDTTLNQNYAYYKVICTESNTYRSTKIRRKNFYLAIKAIQDWYDIEDMETLQLELKVDRDCINL